MSKYLRFFALIKGKSRDFEGERAADREIHKHVYALTKKEECKGRWRGRGLERGKKDEGEEKEEKRKHGERKRKERKLSERKKELVRTKRKQERGNKRREGSEKGRGGLEMKRSERGRVCEGDERKDRQTTHTVHNDHVACY